MAKGDHSKGGELYLFDEKVRLEGFATIIGIDEVGRGPLAGPVMAAAVILDEKAEILQGINDSKKLTEAKRDELFLQITNSALAWAYGSASPEEIEKLNILQATFLAMRRALEQITIPWSLALVDGNRPIDGISLEKQRCVVTGDARSASIAAASIVAKVTRDKIMTEYHQMFPQYEFNSHKGYGTEIHRNRIEEFGLCEIHRRSFCESLMVQQTNLFI